MGFVLRKNFNRGWVPSVDAVNAPDDCLLRADNLILDELGIPSLRLGSSKINSTVLTDKDVHSLYTVNLSGARYRYAGVSNAVYRNGSSIATLVQGTGDIAFGSHMDQVLFARGITKKKDDGGTLRNWGIAKPGSAPTLAVATADSKTFATGASTESPAFVANEGTVLFSTDRAGTANEAIEVTPDATTGRGTITKTFAAPTDFTVYDAAQVGADEDLLDLYVYITEPQYLSSLTLMIDVNDGTFEQDWYSYVFEPGQPIEIEESLVKATTIPLTEGYKTATIFKYGLGGSLHKTAKKTHEMITGLASELRTAIKGTPAQVDILKSLGETEAEMLASKASTLGLNKNIRGAIENLTEEIADVAPSGIVDLATAQEIKRSIGKLGAWQYGNRDPASNAMEKVANNLYTKLRLQIEKASPQEVAEINKKLAELIPVEHALIRRIPVADRNNIFSLGDMAALIHGVSMNPANMWLFALNKMTKSGTIANILNKMATKGPSGATVGTGAAAATSGMDK